MVTAVNDYLPISALQHYAYCPRQFALIHIEQSWSDNRFIAEGHILHERVDSGEKEKRGVLRYERSVQLISRHYRIRGRMDLLEIELGDSLRYFPVEYKRGKPKTEDWDRIQLCAQALCIEEMKSTQVLEGAIWYSEVRRRETVTLDDELRRTTVATIENAREVFAKGLTPSPIDKKQRCRACSLVDLCQPNTFRQDASARYVKQLGE